MIQLEYRSDEFPIFPPQLEVLTLDPSGKARLVSATNGLKPELREIGVYERQLSGQELEALERDLAPARLLAQPDQPRAPRSESSVRLLAVATADAAALRIAHAG